MFLYSIFLLHVSRTGLGFVCRCACVCICFFFPLKGIYCLAFLCVKRELIMSLWRFCSLVDISYAIEFCNLLLGFWKWEGISLGCSSSSSYIIKCPCPVFVIHLVMSREIELAKIWNYGQFARSFQFHSPGVYKVILGDFFLWSSGPFFGEEHINRIIELMSSCTGSFTETQLGEVRFPEISAPILEKVCQYFYWSLQFARLASCSNSLAFGVVKLCTFGLGARRWGGCVGVYD